MDGKPKNFNARTGAIKPVKYEEMSAIKEIQGLLANVYYVVMNVGNRLQQDFTVLRLTLHVMRIFISQLFKLFNMSPTYCMCEILRISYLKVRENENPRFNPFLFSHISKRQPS